MKLFINLRILQKMMLLLGVTLLALGIISGMATYFMRQMADDISSMYQNRLIPVELLNSVRSNQHEIRGKVNALLSTTDASAQESLKEDIENVVKENETMLAQYEASALDSFEKEHYQKAKESRAVFKQARIEATAMLTAGKGAEAAAYFNAQASTPFDTLNEELTKLAAHSKELAENASATSMDKSKSYSIMMLVLAGAAIAICIGLILLISQSIRKPLHALQALMKQAEHGDLTVEGSYVSKDEIGSLTQSFNHMVSGFRTLISNLAVTSDSLYASADNLAASAEQGNQTTESVTNHMQQIATGAEAQRTQVQETSAAIEEMSAGIVTVANRSKEANQLSLQAAQQTAEGSKAVEQVVSRMQNMGQVVQESSALVGRMRDRSKDIEGIVGAITAISSQTNLLALNASIEAARAGEAGKGFAVVADEVRKLAEQTASSADEITKLIAQINEESQRSVSAMDKVNQEVHGSMEGVDHMGKLFASIASSVSNVTAQVQEVSSTMQELSVGSSQVAAASGEISSISEQSTGMIQGVAAAAEEQLASMEEIAESAVRLQEMAKELKDVVKTFKLA